MADRGGAGGSTKNRGGAQDLRHKRTKRRRQKTGPHLYAVGLDGSDKDSNKKKGVLAGRSRAAQSRGGKKRHPGQAPLEGHGVLKRKKNFRDVSPFTYGGTARSFGDEGGRKAHAFFRRKGGNGGVVMAVRRRKESAIPRVKPNQRNSCEASRSFAKGEKEVNDRYQRWRDKKRGNLCPWSKKGPLVRHVTFTKK